MRTTANTRQLPSPDFTEAEVQARVAAKEFAQIAGLDGKAAALALFNRRVSFWANHFTNVRYRRWVYTVGSCMDGETHEFTISQAALRAKYRERHPGKKVPCYSTIQNYNEAMAAAGIFDVIHHRQDSESEHPGAYESTEYRVHFDRVLIGDQVVPHDFTQVSLGAKSAETDTSHSRTKTSNGSWDGFTDGSWDGFTDIRLPSTSSPTSSKTASSSLADDVVGSNPSGENRAKASTRTKATARSGSTAQGTDDSLDGYPDLVEYVSDLEGCLGALAVRLGVAEDEIDVKPLAKMFRDICIRYEFTCMVSDVIDAFRDDIKMWIRCSRKDSPVGYFLFMVKKEMIKQDKENAQADRDAWERAEVDRLKARLDELHTPGYADMHLRTYLTGPNGLPRLQVQIKELARAIAREERQAS